MFCRRFFILVSVGISFVLPTHAASENKVFLIPHQDDEMFMAGHIAREVNAGNNVYVVLVTNGGSSSVREKLNDFNNNFVAKDCAFPSWVNCPIKLCMDSFTKISFSKARNRELLGSLVELGVDGNHVYFGSEPYSDTSTSLINDNTLTAERAQSLIETLEAKIGVGTFSTVYPYNQAKQHRDHKALGMGLKKARIASEKRFFYEGSIKEAAVKLSAEELKAKHNALNSYFLWKPEDGRFSIGGNSVRNMLNFWKTYAYEFVTTTPASYVNS